MSSPSRQFLRRTLRDEARERVAAIQPRENEARPSVGAMFTVLWRKTRGPRRDGRVDRWALRGALR